MTFLCQAEEFNGTRIRAETETMKFLLYSLFFAQRCFGYSCSKEEKLVPQGGGRDDGDFCCADDGL